MNEQLLEKWRPIALAIDSEEVVRPRVPMAVLLGEAVDTVGFIKRHFRAGQSEGTALPGLEQVVSEGRVTSTTEQEILELRDALDLAHVRFLLALDPPRVDLMKQGEAILTEITSVLDYLFEDGQRTVEDDQLERLAGEYGNPQSQDVLAAALMAYSGLARGFGERLTAIQFDLAVLDEAQRIAAGLRERSASPPQRSAEADQARDLRDRLAHLLATRINAVRAAARLVFRKHPRVIREATSAYQRRRTAAARRAAQGEAPAAAPLVVGG